MMMRTQLCFHRTPKAGGEERISQRFRLGAFVYDLRAMAKAAAQCIVLHFGSKLKISNPKRIGPAVPEYSTFHYPITPIYYSSVHFLFHHPPNQKPHITLL